MKFRGELKFPEIDHPGVPVTFMVEGSQAELLVDGESLGRWSLYDIRARRLVSSAFQIELEGTEVTFVAEDPIDFAYRGVEHMAETWATMKSKRVGTRSLAVRKSRKGTVPSRIDEMRLAMQANLDSQSAPRQIAGEVSMPDAAPMIADLGSDRDPAFSVTDASSPVSETDALVDSPIAEEMEAEPSIDVAEATRLLEEEKQRLAEERVKLEEERIIAEQREADRVEAFRLEMERLEAERDEVRRQAEELSRPAATPRGRKVTEPEQEAELEPTPGPEPALASPEPQPELEAQAEPAEPEREPEPEAEPAQPEPEPVLVETAPVVDLNHLDERSISKRPLDREPSAPRHRSEPEPALAGAAKDKGGGLMGAVRSAFRSSSKDHEHQFIEAPGGMGITRYVCEECGYVSISA